MTPEERREYNIKQYSNNRYSNTKCTDLIPITVNEYEGVMYIVEYDLEINSKKTHMKLYNAMFEAGGDLYFGLSASNMVIFGGEDEFMELLKATFHKMELK